MTASMTTIVAIAAKIACQSTAKPPVVKETAQEVTDPTVAAAALPVAVAAPRPIPTKQTGDALLLSERGHTAKPQWEIETVNAILIAPRALHEKMNSLTTETNAPAVARNGRRMMNCLMVMSDRPLALDEEETKLTITPAETPEIPRYIAAITPLPLSSFY